MTDARASVLVVEDDENAASALVMLLDATGHDATAAGRVAEAIERARTDRPDALLLDLTLPDGDGLDVLLALQREAIAPRVVVALTGHDDPETTARCVDAGCRAVLVKPVRPAALLASLGVWLAE